MNFDFYYLSSIKNKSNIPKSIYKNISINYDKLKKMNNYYDIKINNN